jgi:hypothetical protein
MKVQTIKSKICTKLGCTGSVINGDKEVFSYNDGTKDNGKNWYSIRCEYKDGCEMKECNEILMEKIFVVNAGVSLEIGGERVAFDVGTGVVDVLGAGRYTPQTHAGRVSLLPQDARFPPHARVVRTLKYMWKEGEPAYLAFANLRAVNPPPTAAWSVTWTSSPPRATTFASPPMAPRASNWPSS